uniref:Uncharacterized protein n=1 Tax=Chelonoidis abingdonii TaxID=106734 RepID=A0A8C0G6E3_CHEAB
MHQIYSCSDENLEVFTTVISSKWVSLGMDGKNTRALTGLQVYVSVAEHGSKRKPRKRVSFGQSAGCIGRLRIVSKNTACWSLFPLCSG